MELGDFLMMLSLLTPGSGYVCPPLRDDACEKGGGVSVPTCSCAPYHAPISL